MWTINPQPFKGAHFAAYPVKLVTPCIKAGTSNKGCCPHCGAPWRRVVDRVRVTRERPNALTKRSGEDGTGNYCPNDVDGVVTKTTAWVPTCRCPAHDPVPCTVLDPFGGAATTALAAMQLGRRSVIVERKAEYIEIGRKRVADWHPAKVKTKRRAKPKPNEWHLFGMTA